MKKFVLSNMHNRLENYVFAVDVLKHYIHIKNEQEIETRSKHLRLAGLKPPQNLRECDEMINDLRNWEL